MTADKEFPKMIVFGLDHTLWPFKVHVNYVSPFNKVHLHKHSGIDYEDMLFFDDQWKNNIEPAYLNVTCWWVINGLNKIKLNKGLVNWNECHKILQNPKFEISDFKKAENLI
uniref:Uncharacterized protein n=1 Tax=Cacopsylla melanoneura TaxID=428564 RepID=A0A8D8MCD9_9HEMI